MSDYVVLIPYLDECGSVYLPGLGVGGSATRLNPRATEVWRAIASSGKLDADHGSADDMLFVRQLLLSGAIGAREDEDDGTNEDRLSESVRRVL